MRKIYNTLPFLFVLITGLITQSCKKEYENEKRSDNVIEKFIIANSVADSTKCLINGDTISVFFNPDVTLPATITPTIVVSENATVSPASRTTVPLKDTTTFKVTAENGEVRTYKLKIVKALPTPNIGSINSSVIWLNTTQLYVYGEYFLTGTDTSQVSVFVRRVSDGFEFPLGLNKKQMSNYTIIASIPAFSAEQGVGLHQLFVKSGNRTSKGADLYFYAPPISNVAITSSFSHDGKDIHEGDSLTVNYTVTSSSYNGRMADFYNTQQIATVSLYFEYEQTVDITEFTRTANSVKFKLPESINKYIGRSLPMIRIYYKSVAPDWIISSSYRHNIYFTAPSPVKAKS